MIRYRLRCEDGHDFESWFASAAAFDALRDAGMLSCAVCSAGHVAKAPMAPRLSAPHGQGEESAPGARPLSTPASPAEQALMRLRQQIETGSDDVGRDFVHEARRIHAGAAPRRAIRGEARLDEARGLIEDGVPVVPLPWPARRDTN